MTLAAPLQFRPFAFPKVWGGEQLEAFLGETFEEHPLGEVWQLVDREGCSSVVAGGPFAERRLSGLMLSEREDLLGAAHASAADHFPLLVKLLDAAMPLSIQVHPDERTAQRLKGEAKDECWYILEAGPDATLYLGLREGVDAKTFAMEAGGPKVVDLLEAHSVRRGQFVAVPAGTVHAIGSGVTLVEIQENADTTYRLFDWERLGLEGRPRPLHVEEALQSIDFESRVAGPVDPVFEAVDGGVNARARLWNSDSFEVELLRVNRAWDRDTDHLPVIYIVVAGSGKLRYGDGGDSFRVRRGETWLVPAAVGPHRFEECSGELEVLTARPRA